MKIFKTCLLTAAMGLTACGGGSSSSSSSVPAATPEPSPPPAASPAPDPTPAPTPDPVVDPIQGKMIAGLTHTCMLDSGNLDCWGRNEFAQATLPEEVEGVIDADAGENFTCAIHSQTEISCWGDNTFGQLDAPSNIVNPTKIVTGKEHACALDDSGVVCWGSNENEQLNAPELNEPVLQLVADWDVTCAVMANDMQCWGDNDSPRLQFPDNLTDVKDVAIGESALCLIESNAVSCFGSNRLGQLILPEGIVEPTAITAFNGGFCVIDGGDATCWGSVDQFGETSQAPQQLQLTQIDGLGRHICGVGAEQAACWGANFFGESVVPGELGTLKDIVAEGYHDFCLVGDQGTHCVSQFNDKENASSLAKQYSGADHVITSTWGHGCALTGTNLDCFGTIDQEEFNEPGVINNALSFEVGNGFVCYLNTQNTVTCFGNENGLQSDAVEFLNGKQNVSHFDMSLIGACVVQSGNISCNADLGEGLDTLPAPQGLADIQYLGMGFFHACVLDGDTPMCWGATTKGRTKVPDTVNDIQEFKVGAGHNCAIDAVNGTVCWGSANDKHDPSVPADLAPLSLIDISLQFTCGFDGESVHCWSGNPEFGPIRYKVRVAGL